MDETFAQSPLTVGITGSLLWFLKIRFQSKLKGFLLQWARYWKWQYSKNMTLFQKVSWGALYLKPANQIALLPVQCFQVLYSVLHHPLVFLYLFGFPQHNRFVFFSFQFSFLSFYLKIFMQDNIMLALNQNCMLEVHSAFSLWSLKFMSIFNHVINLLLCKLVLGIATVSPH